MAISIFDEEELERKKKKIVGDGKSKFHVLADFDRTLTKAFVNGKKVPSIISYLRNGKYLTEDYAPRAHALFDKYHPVEINPNIDSEEKKKRMYEWWSRHFDLLVECGLDRETIKQAVSDMIKEGAIELRHGMEEFLNILRKNNIPLIIVSASLGDIILEYLKQKRLFYNNMRLVANVLKFDDKGKFKGVDKIIHSFNKHEAELKNLAIYRELKKRRNVLLLGNTIGDLGMIEGFDYDNIIKIGFLNEDVKEHINLFKENFDVVLSNDSDFKFINSLIREIV